jgi:NADPH:quinone reductase-like Zn-dependent oxidoreductase
MSGETMKAVVVREHGGLDRLELIEVERPAPGPGEVRVRIVAMALNHLDVWVRRGVPGARFPLPLIPGSDGAGVIDAVGEGVSAPAVGDRVFILPGVSCGRCVRCLDGADNLCRDYQILGESRHGTCAEAIVLPASNVAPLPERLGMEEGASFGLSFLTAWHMLVHKARLTPGDRVLVHAAASGVSSAGIQIARHLGALVAATAGSAEKLDLARRLGADTAFNYREEDWVARAREWAGREGVDVVFDHVGADTFARSLRTLGRGGRYVFCGATSGFELKTDFRLAFFKNYEILGSTMGRRADLLRVARLIDAGRLRPIVGETFPLAEIATAHERLEERRVLGKIVVRVA